MSVKFTALFTVLFLFAAGAVRRANRGRRFTACQFHIRDGQHGSRADLVHESRSRRAAARAGAGRATRPVSGTQTLPTINASTNYTLTCTLGHGFDRGSLGGAHRQYRRHGTLTNLAGFRVYYGTSSTSLSQQQDHQRRDGAFGHGHRA